MNSSHNLQYVSRIEIGRVSQINPHDPVFVRDIRFVGEDGVSHTITAFSHSRTGLSLHMVRDKHLTFGSPTEEPECIVAERGEVES